MLNRDYRDIVAGALLVMLGAATFLFTISSYALGTVTQMGPGMVPATLGAILVVFGGIIAAGAFFRTGELPDIRVLTPLIVLASILVFALTIDPFGILPAIFLSTIVATFAELTFRPVVALVLAAMLTLLGYLVFSLALGLPIPLLAWPF